jgi:hypothetical protein
VLPLLWPEMNRSDAVFLSLWVASLAVTWVSMVLRFVARGLILKTMRWDDALATVSLVRGRFAMVRS